MHRITAGFIFTDSHSQTHIHRFTFSQARSVPPLPRLLLSPGPAELRRIDRACLVDYSCVTPATKTHENALGGPFWSDTWSRNATETCHRTMTGVPYNVTPGPEFSGKRGRWAIRERHLAQKRGRTMTGVPGRVVLGG